MHDHYEYYCRCYDDYYDYHYRYRHHGSDHVVRHLETTLIGFWTLRETWRETLSNPEKTSRGIGAPGTVRIP